MTGLVNSHTHVHYRLAKEAIHRLPLGISHHDLVGRVVAVGFV
jgi:hypothetical protein